MNLKPVQQLLETEMDRKEFLAYLGASILAVVGISGLAKTLLPTANKQSSAQSNKKVGYGNSTYGG